jgi:hypothetical protein
VHYNVQQTRIRVFTVSFLFQTLTVLNPFHTPEVAALQDTDLAGPLVFCLAFGGFLLLVSTTCVAFFIWTFQFSDVEVTIRLFLNNLSLSLSKCAVRWTGNFSVGRIQSQIYFKVLTFLIPKVGCDRINYLIVDFPMSQCLEIGVNFN